MKFPRMKQGAAVLMGVLMTGLAFAQVEPTEPSRWQLNMTPGVTSTAANAYDAHMMMLWICVIIGIIVFGAMAYAMIKFRHSKGAVPDTTPDPQHQARADLDHHPDPDSGGLGLSGHPKGHGPIRRRPRCRKR